MRNLDEYTNRRVLIIDDNPSIHDDFRKILVTDEGRQELAHAEAAFFGEVNETVSQLDVEFDSAHQGKEGLKKVVAAVKENRPYALAFVDMRMPPGWDGLTTIEQLWIADPDLQVVICTAYSDNSWSDIRCRLGDTDRLLILKKPFDNSEVCQIALALSEKWKVTQQARMKQNELERLVKERTAKVRAMEASLRQKQKLEAIGALAGGVAHEFNNILQVIRGYTQFARDELPVESQPYQDLGHVVEAADRGAAIAGQMLNFSRQQPTHKSNQEVNEIVAATLKMARPVIGEQTELDVNFDKEPAVVCADKNIMSQVLLNLCINARDSMPSGGRLGIATHQMHLSDETDRVLCCRRPNLKPGIYSVITLTDTGCGIPADVRDRIFDPFFTTKEVGKGSGMGLAMAVGAVQDHDGAITVESMEGDGSTFRVFLPVVPLDRLDAPAVESDGDVSRLAGSETILVAEDEKMVRDLTARVLRYAGYTVITAAEGEDALDKFERHADSIDVALLDVVMPKLSGRQVYERIKAHNPKIKVIFCTGYDPETAGPESIDATQVATLYKPLATEVLLSTLRRMIEGEPLCHTI